MARQCPEIKEKLNFDGGLNRMINPYLSKMSQWEKGKHKLVYDCSYAHNQVMTDKDIRLYVPNSIRKNGGTHINEKISKYFAQLKNFYALTGHDDQTLLFESRFESGNLGRAR